MGVGKLEPPCDGEILGTMLGKNDGDADGIALGTDEGITVDLVDAPGHPKYAGGSTDSEHVTVVIKSLAVVLVPTPGLSRTQPLTPLQ